MAYETGDVVGTVKCEHCGGTHPAEYSHESPHGGHDVFAVVCKGTDEWLTDYYRAEGVNFK